MLNNSDIQKLENCNLSMADVVFIVKNDNLIYTNNNTKHLDFQNYKDYLRLDGKVAIFEYKCGLETIEFFISFDGWYSYMLFTLGNNRDFILNTTSIELYEYIYNSQIDGIFDFNKDYNVIFKYTYKLYKTSKGYFMNNISCNSPFAIINDKFLRANNPKEKDNLINMFWKD